MNTFTINEKLYKAKKFDFNTICDLEDMGISMSEAGRKPMSMARAYFALHLDGDRLLAGNQIEEHVAKGYDLESLYSAMSKEMDESDFFQNLSKRAKEEIAEMEKTEETEE